MNKNRTKTNGADSAALFARWRATPLATVALSTSLLAACGGGGSDTRSISSAIGSMTPSSQSSVSSEVGVTSSSVDNGSSSSESSSSSVSSGIDFSASSSSTSGENATPMADAGADQSVEVGTEVILDGSASTDSDGDILTYSWTLTELPGDSNAVLVYQTTDSPSFEADVAGIYIATLVVNDGSQDSQAANVSIVVAYDNVDITDIELSRRAGSCSDYVGSYYSNVEDIQRAIGFEGDLVLSSDGTWCTFAANEIPNHDFNDNSAHFATPASEQDGSYTIAANPQMASTTTALSVGLKNIVFLNGVTADLLSAACYAVGNEPIGEEKIGCGQDNLDNPWRYDPMSSLNTFGTDQHNAHPQPDGTYHYHGDPRALFDVDCEANGNVSPVIGFAADGFPVFGPCIEDTGSVRKALPSYVLKDNGGPRQDVTGYETPIGGVGTVASNNYDGQFIGDFEYQEGAGDLDECNGMIVDGQYGYYITDAYPWIIGCFKAEPNDSLRPTGAALQNLLHKHDGNWHSH